MKLTGFESERGGFFKRRTLRFAGPGAREKFRVKYILKNLSSVTAGINNTTVHRRNHSRLEKEDAYSDSDDSDPDSSDSPS